MEKKQCVECGKDFASIDITMTKYNVPLIHHDIFCPACRKKLDEMPIDTKCVECGCMIDKLDGGLCWQCQMKKVDEARANGRCVTCYVKPQSRLPALDGKPSEICLQCAEQWRKATQIWQINDKMFHKTMGLQDKRKKK